MRRFSPVPVVRQSLVAASLALAAAARLTAQAPSTTVSGVAYAQFVMQLKDTANHLNNFDVTRAYINVLGSFAYGIKTRVTGDVYRNTDGSLAYRLKYAYATLTPRDGKSPITFKFGQMHTPWVDWEENLWDYRMQGTVAMDRNGYLSSSDFGAGIDGMWKAEKVNMQVGIYNGENYNKPTGDKQKDVMGRVSVRLMGTNQGGRSGGLRLTGYGQIGKPTGGGRRNRFIGMLSYRSKVLTLAGEFGSTRDTATTPTAGLKNGRVISAFGVVRVPRSKVQFIGRFDSVDPNTASSVINDRTSRIIAGVAYQFSDNLRILGDFDNVSYQGGHTTPANEAVRSQALFQIQFTF